MDILHLWFILQYIFVWAVGIISVIGLLLYEDNEGGTYGVKLIFLVIFIVCCHFDGPSECEWHPEYNYCMKKATLYGDFGDVYRGLKLDGDPHLKVNGKSLLQWAVEKNHKKAAEFLIKKGLHIKADLYLIADSLSSSLLNILLKTKKNMDVALIYATRKDRKNLVDKLLQNGAKINYQDKFGDTALMIAIDKKFNELENVIFKFKPALNIKNKKGETPLIKAAKRNSITLCQKYLHSGAKTNIADNTGVTPLFYAAEHNNLNMVQLLIKKGANVKHKNKKGELPVEQTINLDIVAFMKKKGSPVTEKLADRIVNEKTDNFNDQYLELFYSD